MINKSIKYSIRSSGKFGQSICNHFRNDFSIDIKYYIEPIQLTDDNHKCNSEIISQYRAFELYQKGEINKIIIPGAINAVSLLKIDEELRGFGYRKEDVLVVQTDLFEKGTWDENIYWQIMNSHELRCLEYLEFHVVDNCNMKCNNCTHFSQYVRDNVFAEFDEVERDFCVLKKWIDSIGMIRVLGGECLLNPELSKYLIMVRKYYPFSRIAIVTNGILVEQMSDNLINAILMNDIEVHVSAYPNMFKKIDKISKFLKDRKINYYISDPVYEFSKVIDLSEKKQFPYRTTKGVWGCGCYNLYKGMLSICPTVCYSKYYDIAHNTTQCSELSKGGFLKLDNITSYSELIDFLEKPCELCDYCLFYRSPYNSELREKWKRIE